MKFACYTLGCKVNQYETQAMEQLLVQSGHTLGSFDEICDGYIINTCTVTAVSDKKSRNAIRRVRKLNPAAAVGVCGCYAQSSPDEIRKLDVDVLIGTDGREAFVRHMIEAAEGRGRVQQFLHLLHHPLCPRPGALHAAAGRGGAGEGPCRRGLPRDRHQRHRDLLLGLGVEGRQLPAAAAGGALRGSPRGPDPPGLAGAAHHRRGLLQDALRLPQSLPAVPPESAVRLRYRPAADAPPVRTPAAAMPGQIPNAVKERRAAEAAAVAAELETQYHTALLGTTQQVLFEQEEDGLYAGHAMNYVKVYVQAADLHNEIRAVRITELCRDGVFGELE